MKALTYLVATVGLVAVVGCSDGTNTPPPDPVLVSYNRQLDAQIAATAAGCVCYSTVGSYANSAECVAASGLAPLTATQSSCLSTLFAASGDVLNPTYECRATATVAATECLKAVAACNKADVLACLSTLQTSIAACPVLDAASQLAVEACVPPAGT